MAYGKIKADAIIYDNSGSDVEKTIAVLAAPTPEGTVVKSTGESGSAKFLRTDGDGTCSWQIPPDTNTQLTLIDEDNMSSDSATSVPSQQSVKAYVDAGDLSLIDEDNMSTNSATRPPSQQSVKAYVDTADALKANLANPTFTGTVNAAALTLSGNLTVNGTTTTISSTTIDVADKNIELGKVSSPSDTTADGGGITLKGATDKTITWSDTSNYWTFNQGIETTGGAAKITGIEGGDANFYLYADEGDDNADKWLIQSESDGYFALKNYTSGTWETNIKAIGDGTVELYHNDSKKIETTATGVTVTGTVTDSKGDLRKIPLNNITSAYTAVAADAGKTIYTNSGVTINNSVFATGDAVTIVNSTGSDITITQGSGLNLYNSADASTGNRTLAGRGMATIYFAATNYGYISGAGLS